MAGILAVCMVYYKCGDIYTANSLLQYAGEGGGGQVYPKYYAY